MMNELFDNFSAASRSRSTNCSYRSTLTLPTFCLLGTTPMPCQASICDNAGGTRLLSRIATANPRVTKAWTSATAPASASMPKSSNATPVSKGSR